MSGQSGSLTDSPMEEQVYKLGLAAIGLGSSTATASPRVVVGPPESTGSEEKFDRRAEEPQLPGDSAQVSDDQPHEVQQHESTDDEEQAWQAMVNLRIVQNQVVAMIERQFMRILRQAFMVWSSRTLTNPGQVMKAVRQRCRQLKRQVFASWASWMLARRMKVAQELQLKRETSRSNEVEEDQGEE